MHVCFPCLYSRTFAASFLSLLHVLLRCATCLPCFSPSFCSLCLFLPRSLYGKDCWPMPYSGFSIWLIFCRFALRFSTLQSLGSAMSFPIFLNGASISHPMCLCFLRQVSTCLVQYVQEPNTGNHDSKTQTLSATAPSGQCYAGMSKKSWVSPGCRLVSPDDSR